MDQVINICTQLTLKKKPSDAFLSRWNSINNNVARHIKLEEALAMNPDIREDLTAPQIWLECVEKKSILPW